MLCGFSSARPGLRTETRLQGDTASNSVQTTNKDCVNTFPHIGFDCSDLQSLLYRLKGNVTDTEQKDFI